MSKVSVIIPTYNYGIYIAEAITSVLNQTYKPHEIIVVDDGSIDQTSEIVKSFSSENIIYVYQDNAGVSAARNAGLDRATGDFVAFLDADDRWYDTMLEEQVSILKSTPEIAFSVTNFRRFEHSTGKLLSDQFAFYPEVKSLKREESKSGWIYLVEDNAFEKLIEFGEPPTFPSVMMFRRSIISDIRFQAGLAICEDLHFVMRVASKGGQVRLNSQVLMEMRRHDTNATKEWHGMAVKKLEAFLYLRESVELSESQRRALDIRLVKAYIDAALYSMRAGELDKARSFCISALAIKGSWMKKFKGLARLSAAYTIKK